MGQNLYYRYVTLWKEILQTDGTEHLLQVCNTMGRNPSNRWGRTFTTGMKQYGNNAFKQMRQNLCYRYVTLREEILQTDGAEPLLQVCNTMGRMTSNRWDRTFTTGM